MKNHPLASTTWQEPFCPLHNSISPCMDCILPEVAQIVLEYNKDYKGTVVLQQADENPN